VLLSLSRVSLFSWPRAFLWLAGSMTALAAPRLPPGSMTALAAPRVRRRDTAAVSCSACSLHVACSAGLLRSAQQAAA
jgi:hypothetical protein